GLAGDEVTFLTMELLEGETLAVRLARQGRMSEAEALPIVTQMTGALTAAHQAGIIHRDFKSANVMLGPEEAGTPRAVVMDFGLACYADETEGTTLTASGAIIGTPAYMAPEQFENGPITPATDVYALGVVLYEMVTGARPFPGNSPLAAAFQRFRQPAPTPRVLAPHLDPKWESAILRCLAREAGERFGSAAEVLEAITSGAQAVARPTPAQAAISLRPRRLAFLALLVVVVLALAAAWRWWPRGPYQPSPEAA